MLPEATENYHNDFKNFEITILSLTAVKECLKFKVGTLEKYDLDHVKTLAATDNIQFDNGSDVDAYNDFGFTLGNLINVIQNLTEADYRESIEAKDPWIMGEQLDVYHKRIGGRKLYLKFFIEDDQVIIVWSCHRSRHE